MANLYADENFPQPSVEALRELGHDVLTTLDSGKAGQAIPDKDVLAFAKETQRVLLTSTENISSGFIGNSPIILELLCVLPIQILMRWQLTSIRHLKQKSDMTGQLVRVNRSG